VTKKGLQLTGCSWGTFRLSAVGWHAQRLAGSVGTWYRMARPLLGVVPGCSVRCVVDFHWLARWATMTLRTLLPGTVCSMFCHSMLRCHSLVGVPCWGNRQIVGGALAIANLQLASMCNDWHDLSAPSTTMVWNGTPICWALCLAVVVVVLSIINQSPDGHG
jgi:hypothetical protein